MGCTLTYLNFISFFVNRSKINDFMGLLRKDNVELFPGLIELYHFLPFFGKTVELVNPLENVEEWMIA